MSTAENKLSLVQMIVESEDKAFISKVLEYARSLKKEKTTHWEEELPEYVAEELRLSIEEATLFYRIESKNRIRLLLFWDNRNNPKKSNNPFRSSKKFNYQTPKVPIL